MASFSSKQEMMDDLKRRGKMIRPLEGGETNEPDQKVGEITVETNRGQETFEERRIQVVSDDGESLKSRGFHFFKRMSDGAIFFDSGKPSEFQQEAVNMREKIAQGAADYVNAGNAEFVEILSVDDKVDRAVVKVHNTDGSTDKKVVGLDSNDNLTFA